MGKPPLNVLSQSPILTLNQHQKGLVMCGRFAQVQTRADYLDVLASDLDFASALDNVPISRYNVAPGTRVLVLNQRDDKLYLDPLEVGIWP